MAIQDDWTIDSVAYTLTYTGGLDSDGAPNSIYTVNELYSWLMDEFDQPSYMDDPIPMSAQTPVEYTILWPWFIDDASMQALYEGAIQTSNWTRVVTGSTGIVQVRYDTFTAQPVAGDIGKACTHDVDNDSGTLVGYDNTRQIIWIRPDDDTAANNFDSVANDITVPTGTMDIDQDYAADDGESVWACIYTLGSLESYSEIYLYQISNFVEDATPSYTKLGPWWYQDVDFSGATGVETGHVDLVIKVQEIDTLIDYGRILVLARQYSKTYAHYEVVTTGGRTPIPLGTLDDLDNESGHRQFITNAEAGAGWTSADVGLPFREDGAGDERNIAIMTDITGTGPNYTVQYYLVGTQTDFLASSVLEDMAEAKTMTMTASAPTDVGPAADTSVDVTFGATTGDVDEDGTDEYYSVILDCNSQRFNEVYERIKYLTRRGQTSDIDQGTQTVDYAVTGEYYQGIGEYYVPFDTGSVADPFSEGEVVTWTGGTAIVRTKQARAADVGFLILFELRGTALTDGLTITGGTSGHTADVDTDGGADPVEAITEIPQSPFGTYAGGSLFLARGVLLSNVHTSDASLYQAIDSEGNVITPPNKVTVAVTGLSTADRAAMYEVQSAGSTLLIKNQHGLAAGNNESDTDIVVDSAISSETPGKTTGGVIVCVDVSDTGEERETRYRYTGFDNVTFTLSAGITGAADAGGSATRLVDAGVDFTATDVEVGDRIYNSSQTEYATIVKIVDADNIDTTPLPSATWANTDTYQTNQLDRSYDGANDEAYVPVLDAVAAASSVSNTLVHSTDIDVMVRVRWASGADPILPFQQTNLLIQDTGLSVPAIRNPDSIKS